MRTIITTRRLVSVLGLGVLALAACSPTPGAGGSAASGASDTGGETAVSSDRTEVAALTPRIVLAHDGGVTTIDSADGAVLGSADVEGYVRLNPAGDGRHVALSTADGFTFYDTGLLAQGHGDHFHSYVQDPALTDITVQAPHPGHVVPHAGRTALFADGTGAVTLFDPASLTDGTLGKVQETATGDPHHGVAVPMEGGGLLLTQGTEEERSTVQVKDASGKVVAQTDDCPGIHGGPPRSPARAAT